MQWFKHMSNMRHDVKMKRVIKKYGLAGYGLYNLIIESITEKLTTESPLPDLQETCDDIAAFYNGNTVEINEITSFMINQGLFELDEMSGNVLCNKVYKFIESSQTRSKEIREMINKYKKSSQLLLESPESLNVSDSLRQSDTVSDFCEEQNRTEQKRREQNKTEKTSWTLKDIIKMFDAWNKQDLPKYPEGLYKTGVNIKDSGEILNYLKSFNKIEISQAIRNYAKIRQSSEHELKPEYGDALGFFKAGIHKYYDNADSFERCKKKSFFKTDDPTDEDRKRFEKEQEHYRKLEEEEESERN